MNILHVKAGVRYWEDATVNGITDADGTLIPFRLGDCWCPKINIDTGIVLDWPKGTVADIHYKVCDDGQYWIGTESETLLRWCGDYVPDEFLCHGDDGYGDYVILKIGADGKIADFVKPAVSVFLWSNEKP